MIKKKIKLIFIIFMSLTLTNCGYKNVGSSSKNKFQVEKINIKGNAKDAYILKNEILLYSSKNTVNLIELDITINNISETKEKNIKNLVTKYQNIYNVSMKMKIINEDKIISKSFRTTDSYLRSTNHSDTLMNRKKSAENMVLKMADEIVNYITIYFNI
tara:strand:- start:603 stop:1079 length:477 start_codon:yes stop_codon:yes gene_type:complete